MPLAYRELVNRDLPYAGEIDRPQPRCQGRPINGLHGLPIQAEVLGNLLDGKHRGQPGHTLAKRLVIRA